METNGTKLPGKIPKGLLSCLIMVILFACSDQPDNRANTTTQPKHPIKAAYEGTIIVLGDSLTAGLGVAEKEAYPALLEKELQRNGINWRVINAGTSGETSSGALSRTGWIIAQQPDIVILETGANDGMRGIPIKVIKENIKRIVRLFKEANVEVVLAGMQMLQNLGPGYTEDFAAIFPEVAAEQEIILVPHFLEKVGGDPSLNQRDAIHPNREGHRILAQTVYPYVVQAIQQAQK
jgi:acyl-CoA thioesterase-1